MQHACQTHKFGADSQRCIISVICTQVCDCPLFTLALAWLCSPLPCVDGTVLAAQADECHHPYSCLLLATPGRRDVNSEQLRNCFYLPVPLQARCTPACSQSSSSCPSCAQARARLTHPTRIQATQPAAWQTLPRLPHHQQQQQPMTSAPPSSQSCSAAQPPPLTRSGSCPPAP